MKRTSVLVLLILMILSLGGCGQTKKQTSSRYVQSNNSSEQTSSKYVQSNASSEQTSSGYVQSNNSSKQTNVTQKGYKYQFKQCSFYIPESWKDKFVEKDFTFYSKSNYGTIYGGRLFSMKSTDTKNSWKQYPVTRYLGYADGTYYYMFLPSDVQFDDTNHDLEEEYEKMEKDINGIMASVVLHGNKVSYNKPESIYT